MFFVLSKILGLLLQPVNFLVLIGIVGLLLWLTPFKRSGKMVAATAAVLFAICCFSPLGSALLRPLEDRFPLPPDDMPAPAGIVVLGGSIDPDLGAARGVPTLTEAASRLTSGVALALKYPKAKLVFTGGTSNVRQKGVDEATGVRELWTSLGVPKDRMTFEDKSRNTFENAVFTRDLVKPKEGETWLLVTSASHMPRSVGIFRKVGWPVVAYPVDYRTFGDDRDYRLSTVALDALERTDTAFHEWVGLAAYWLTNKTSALFPAP